MDLGTLETPPGFPTYSFAYDINNAGQVVGLSTAPQILPTPRGHELAAHAVLWDKGVMTDLGTLGGDFSSATGINPAGEVVGSSLLLPAPRNTGEDAFLWKDGVMTDLGTLGGRESVPWDINPSGQVVGSSQTAGGGTSVFLWQKGVMTDLNTLLPPGSGWTLLEARAITSRIDRPRVMRAQGHRRSRLPQSR